MRVSFGQMRDLLHAVRTAVTFAVTIPATVLAAVLVIAITMTRPTSPSLDRVARIWGRTWCWMAGVKLRVEGLENIETGRSYVVVSNHQSAFDIFAHVAALPFPIRFLAKTELFKIPLFGVAMRKIGMVEVNRGAGRAAHQAINQGARKTMEQGWSLMIYPEGTRPRDGVMLPFKKGAFSIARNVRAPILPTAITGSRSVWKPKTKVIRSGEITVMIMPPIPTEGMMIYQTTEVRNQVHAQISDVVGQATLVQRASR